MEMPGARRSNYTLLSQFPDDQVSVSVTGAPPPHYDSSLSSASNNNSGNNGKSKSGFDWDHHPSGGGGDHRPPNRAGNMYSSSLGLQRQSSGSSFGGVIAFLYGDLIVLPLVIAYAKYYGLRPALSMTGILFVSMVGAGIVVDLLFSATGLVPEARPPSPMSGAEFAWNYTTWLDLAAIAVGGALVGIHLRSHSKTQRRHAAHHT